MPIDYKSMSAQDAVKKFVKEPQSRVIQITMSKKNWAYCDENAKLLAKRHKAEYTDELENLLSVFVHVGMLAQALPKSVKKKIEKSADEIVKLFDEEEDDFFT